MTAGANAAGSCGESPHVGKSDDRLSALIQKHGGRRVAIDCGLWTDRLRTILNLPKQRSELRAFGCHELQPECS